MAVKRIPIAFLMIRVVESSEDLLNSRESVPTSSRFLQGDASRHGRKPNCPFGYVDRTGGNAFWWQCANARCPGPEPWATSHCDCACVSQGDFVAIRSGAGASTSAQPVVITSTALMSTSQTNLQPTRQPFESSTSKSNFLAPYLTTEISHTTQSQLEFPSSVQAQASPNSQADGRRDNDNKLSLILVVIAISLSYIIGCAVVGLCFRKYMAFAQQRANAKGRHACPSEARHFQKMGALSSKLSRVHPDQKVLAQATMSKSVVVVQAPTGHPKIAKFAPQPLALKRLASGGSGFVGSTVPDKSDTSTCTPSRSSSQVSVDETEEIGEERKQRGVSQTARLG